VQHGDAGGARIVRAAQVQRRAVPVHRAEIRRVGAGEDLDQGRLAGAVLTDQRRHLAGRHVQRHRVQRGRLPEMLADAEGVKGHGARRLSNRQWC
jgi:hypothetical protein